MGTLTFWNGVIESSTHDDQMFDCAFVEVYHLDSWLDEDVGMYATYAVPVPYFSTRGEIHHDGGAYAVTHLGEKIRIGIIYAVNNDYASWYLGQHSVEFKRPEGYGAYTGTTQNSRHYTALG